MSAANALVIEQTDTDITFTKVFLATRELLFTVFSESEHVKHWWGPEGWTVPICTIDFRPGGVWHYRIRNDAGEEHWAKAQYHEIVPPERIVFIDSIVDVLGNPIEGLPSKRVTVTFDDLDGKTRLKVHVQLASAVDREKLVQMGFVRHFPETLNHLEQLINSLK